MKAEKRSKRLAQQLAGLEHEAVDAGVDVQQAVADFRLPVVGLGKLVGQGRLLVRLLARGNLRRPVHFAGLRDVGSKGGGPMARRGFSPFF